jgi:hypothetical protein
MRPPKEYRSIPRGDLLRKFLLENLEQQLNQHYGMPVLWKCGNFKTGYEWFDVEKSLMCRLFKYHHPKVENTVVRQLRDGDVFYDIDLPAGTVIVAP